MPKIAGILASGARRNSVGNPATTEHRYWRLFFNGVDSGENVAIAEVEFLRRRFYERMDGTYAASGEPNPAQSLFRASDGTYTRSTSSEWWGSNNAPGDIWISIDAGFGNDFILEGFTLAGGNLLPTWTSIEVQWSDDNSSWTTEWEEFAFDEYAALNAGSSGSYANTPSPVSWTNPNIATFVPFAGFNKDGILVWLKADDGAFSDNLTTPAVAGDPVQTLTNHAGGSLLLQQNTLANRPIFRTGGAAGLPYLEFDSSLSHFLEDIAYTMAAGLTSYERTRQGILCDVGEMPDGTEYTIIGGVEIAGKVVWSLRGFATGPMKIHGVAYSNFNGSFFPFGLMAIAVGYGAWANFSVHSENAYGKYYEGVAGSATVDSTAITVAQLFRNTAAADGAYFDGKVYEFILAQDNSKTTEFGQVQAYHIQQYLFGRKILGTGGSIPQGLFLVDNDGNTLRVDTGALLKVTPPV